MLVLVKQSSRRSAAGHHVTETSGTDLSGRPGICRRTRRIRSAGRHPRQCQEDLKVMHDVDPAPFLLMETTCTQLESASIKGKDQQ